MVAGNGGREWWQWRWFGGGVGHGVLYVCCTVRLRTDEVALGHSMTGIIIPTRPVYL